MPIQPVLARIVDDPHLPTPPAVALKVLDKASKPDCDVREISALLSLDAGLCARILKIVNSAFYTLRYKVTSVDRAVAVLGLSRVRALVISLSLPNMKRRSPNDARMRDHWKASVAAAIAAREWAARNRHPDPNNEMVAALLCDLGVHMLSEVYPSEYGLVLAEPIGNFVRRQCELEEKLVGVHHAEVGAYVLRRWGLPEELTEAIRYHHNPTDCPRPEVAERAARLHFASAIGQLQLAPNDPALVADLLQLAADRFQLSATQLEEFLAPLHEKIEEFAALINVNISSTHQYAGLMARAAEQLARLASQTTLENIRVNEEKEQVEQMRRRSEEELDRLSRRHDLILNAVGDGIFGVDRRGTVTFINPAGQRMLGRTAAEMNGQPQHDIMRLSTNGCLPDWADSPIRAVLKDGQPRFIEHAAFTHRDGTTFPVRFSCAPIRDGEDIVGAVVTFRDIGEMKKAEEALRRSEDQLRQAQKMGVVGQLAGGVAHDFNNILTVILGYGDMVTGSLLPNGHPAFKLVAEILKAGERATALTRQLLSFSRKQPIAPKEVQLNTVVTEMEKMLRRLIGEDIGLVTDLAADLGTVRADPGQVEQVLLNLCVNARDAMPKGGTLTIETANIELDDVYTRAHPEVQPGPYVMLAVTDTGCGMDAATMARIFEPFFTTKGPGKGTGLGLATVHDIVKQSAGSLDVSSEVGRGTCFRVLLPRVEALSALPRPTVVAAPRPVGTETLLVAEDDDAVRSFMLAALQTSNYVVIEAVDGLDALRKAEEYPEAIHLLVTDVVMPGMSGGVLAERLVAQRPEMKVLYASGYTDDVVARTGLNEDDVPFLQKPFTLDAFSRKVREVLDQAVG